MTNVRICVHWLLAMGLCKQNVWFNVTQTMSSAAVPTSLLGTMLLNYI